MRLVTHLGYNNTIRMTLHNRRRNDPAYKKLPIIEAVYQLRFVWWLVGVFFVAFGFNFKTPAQHFKDIEIKADSSYVILNNRITTVEKQHESIERYLTTLVYSICTARPRHDVALTRLPCDSLLNTR